MKKSGIFAICGIAFLALGIYFGVKAFKGSYAPRAAVSEGYFPAETDITAGSPAPEGTSVPTAAAAADEAPDETPVAAPAPVPYVSPIDFDELQGVNPDIYAWLQIGNTEISYPVVQNPTDDTFYLDHNSDRDYSANGAVFSEAAYNGTDMEDPVTVLYGHHMKSGAIFGDLQQYYSDPVFFEEDNVITVYTPGAALEYRVFAAAPYSNEHLLYQHDFTDEESFQVFFSGVSNIRDLSAHFASDYFPEAGDRVLILSTCLAGNNTRRFLVMATLVA